VEVVAVTLGSFSLLRLVLEDVSEEEETAPGERLSKATLIFTIEYLMSMRFDE
jgi:hypothetical protein